MLKKLGKTITNNFGLKILAAVFAVVLWIIVINIDNPTISQQYTTTVTAENTKFITAQNKYYEPLDGSNTITFSVSAERNVQDELSGSDFKATADMERIEYNEESGTYRVPVSITPLRYTNKVTVVSKNLYLEVTLEDLGTCQKAITAATRGNVADGCALGEVQIVGSNLLKISGPSSVVSQIDRVEASINVEGMSTDVTDTVVPVLYDADGNAIDTTKLTMSLSTVTISAQILSTKDVSLEFLTMGEVAEGYMFMGVEYSLDTVRIKGEASSLNTVNKIEIPAEVLDITGLTESLDTTVDITSYLPEGTSLVLNSDAKVEVSVKVEPIVTETFVIPTTNLTIENLRDGYKAEFDENTVTVQVSGAESEVAAVNAQDIKGIIDASGIGAGEHELSAEFTIEGSGCWMSDVSVPVTVTRGSSNTADETDDEDARGTAAGTTGTANGTETSGTGTTGTGGTAANGTGTAGTTGTGATGTSSGTGTAGTTDGTGTTGTGTTGTTGTGGTAANGTGTTGTGSSADGDSSTDGASSADASDKTE